MTLFVLPDQARVEERLAALARERRFVAGLGACTLADLERDLVRAAALAGACAEPAAPAAVDMALRKAAADPALVPPLRDLWAALGHGLFDPARPPPGLPLRVEELLRAIAAARSELHRARLADPDQALLAAVDALDRGLPLPARWDGEMVFEAIVDWTPLRRRMAAALARRLRVRLRLPWMAGRPDLNAAVEPALRAFEASCDAPIEVELDDPGAGGPLGPFRLALFSEATATGPVQVRSCASPAAQAREAARACFDRARSGTPLGSIAIAARSLSGGVAEELGAALDGIGLPWRERRGRPALPSRPVRLAMLVYELAEHGIARAGLAGLIGSPLLRLDGQGEGTHRQLRWLDQAGARDAGAGAALRALAARLPEGERAGALETARRTERIVADVRALPDRAAPGEHARALLGLFDRWRVGAALARTPEPGAPALAAAAARDLAALERLRSACAELAAAGSRLGMASVARREWVEMVRDQLDGASLPPAGARGAAVQIVELRELSGRSFEHLVVVGLRDGELPARPSTDPLLSDEDKQAANRLAGRAVFRAPASDGAPDPALFYLALCAARSSILLLRPRADGAGRPCPRSPFADEALRTLGAAEETAPIEAVPAVEACRTAGEVVARAALEAFADPAWRASAPAPRGQAAQLESQVLGSALGPRLRLVARAAAAERERLATFAAGLRPGRFSGGISGPALEAARPHLCFSAASPLSAHQLEQHASCGFKFFAGRLLGVPEAPGAPDDLDARERGLLLHRCLEAFFSRMGRDGRLPLRGGAAREGELCTLREESDAVFDLHEGAGHPALFRVRRAEMQRKLARLVDSEAEAPGVPRDLEMPFGFADEGALPPLDVPSPDGTDTVMVRGRIDRVDEQADGLQLVLDYKSGRIEGLQRKLRPDALCAPEFQLPLYALAIRQARPGVTVDASYVSVASAARSRGLLASGVDGHALFALDPVERERLRALDPPPLNLADRVWERVSAMRAGLFPASPLSCDHCHLGPVCRIVAVPVEEDASLA